MCFAPYSSYGFEPAHPTSHVVSSGAAIPFFRFTTYVPPFASQSLLPSVVSYVFAPPLAGFGTKSVLAPEIVRPVTFSSTLQRLILVPAGVRSSALDVASVLPGCTLRYPASHASFPHFARHFHGCPTCLSVPVVFRHSPLAHPPASARVVR